MLKVKNIDCLKNQDDHQLNHQLFYFEFDILIKLPNIIISTFQLLKRFDFSKRSPIFSNGPKFIDLRLNVFSFSI